MIKLHIRIRNGERYFKKHFHRLKVHFFYQRELFLFIK